MSKPVKIIKCLILVAIHQTMGMLGFTLFEGWQPPAAFQAAVQTLFTFGYDNSHDLSQTGSVFNTVMVVFGVVVWVYVISNIVSFMIEGRMKSYIKVGRMNKMISGLKNHYIICGAGQTGEFIVEEFLEADTPFVVIDKNQERIEKLVDKDIAAIKGDSALNEILITAGVERARGLIAVHSTDAENLLTVLSARQMNADMRIISAVLEKQNDEKYRSFGADATIITSDITGRRLATLAMHTSVSSFLDVLKKTDESMSTSVVEVELEQDGYLVGRSYISAKIREKTGVTILGIIREDENLVNPDLEESFQGNDRLLVFGTNEQITQFKKIASSVHKGKKPDKRSQEKSSDTKITEKTPNKDNWTSKLSGIFGRHGTKPSEKDPEQSDQTGENMSVLEELWLKRKKDIEALEVLENHLLEASDTHEETDERNTRVVRKPRRFAVDTDLINRIRSRARQTTLEASDGKPESLLSDSQSAEAKVSKASTSDSQDLLNTLQEKVSKTNLSERTEPEMSADEAATIHQPEGQTYEILSELLNFIKEQVNSKDEEETREPSEDPVSEAVITDLEAEKSISELEQPKIRRLNVNAHILNQWRKKREEKPEQIAAVDAEHQYEEVRTAMEELSSEEVQQKVVKIEPEETASEIQLEPEEALSQVKPETAAIVSEVQSGPEEVISEHEEMFIEAVSEVKPESETQPELTETGEVAQTEENEAMVKVLPEEKKVKRSLLSRLFGQRSAKEKKEKDAGAQLEAAKKKETSAAKKAAAPKKATGSKKAAAPKKKTAAKKAAAPKKETATKTAATPKKETAAKTATPKKTSSKTADTPKKATASKKTATPKKSAAKKKQLPKAAAKTEQATEQKAAPSEKETATKELATPKKETASKTADTPKKATASKKVVAPKKPATPKKSAAKKKQLPKAAAKTEQAAELKATAPKKETATKELATPKKETAAKKAAAPKKETATNKGANPGKETAVKTASTPKRETSAKKAATPKKPSKPKKSAAKKKQPPKAAAKTEQAAEQKATAPKKRVAKKK